MCSAVCAVQCARYSVLGAVCSVQCVLYSVPLGAVCCSVQCARAVCSLMLMFNSCGRLDYLHTRSPRVLHRDLKPANVLIDECNRCVLADFGISRSLEQTAVMTVRQLRADLSVHVCVV